MVWVILRHPVLSMSVSQNKTLDEGQWINGKFENTQTSSSVKLYIAADWGDSLLTKEYFSSGEMADSLRDCSTFNGAMI